MVRWAASISNLCRAATISVDHLDERFDCERKGSSIKPAEGEGDPRSVGRPCRSITYRASTKLMNNFRLPAAVGVHEDKLRKDSTGKVDPRDIDVNELGPSGDHAGPRMLVSVMSPNVLGLRLLPSAFIS